MVSLLEDKGEHGSYRHAAKLLQLDDPGSELGPFALVSAGVGDVINGQRC